jgi:hypothetical protein
MFEPLQHWHEFYMLLGTGAAALVALQFVAASVGAGYLSFEQSAGTRTYMTPVIVYFSAVLFACAAGLIPWHTPASFAVALGIASVVGALYAAFVSVRVLRDGSGHIEFDDTICHGIVPPVAYAIGAASALMFQFGWPHAASALAVALLLLLAVNIRNAWDLTLFMVRKHTEAKQPHP